MKRRGCSPPRRLENGYRDYSEEDVRTLEKIRLLRSLQLDIGTIRQLQRGTLTLEQVMFNQLTRLEGDRAGLERAARVCRAIQDSGVEYAALEPESLLRELEAPQLSQAPLPRAALLPTLEEELSWECQALSHPWMRWLARWLDLSLCSLPVNAMAYLGLRLDLLADNLLLDWVLALASVAVMAVMEALLLHFWGWTPGKWAMGLELRDAQGNKLSLRAAWRRVWGVFLRGDGLNIPLYNLWRNYRCYRCCKDGEDCPWDEYENRQYTREDRPLFWLMWLGSVAVSVFLTVVILFQTYLPPNRGTLTVEEYCENFNFYLDLVEPDSQKILDESGRWSLRNEDWGVTYFETLGPLYCSDLEFGTAKDGSVVWIQFSEMAYADYVHTGQTRALTAALALAGAQREVNCFTFDAAGWEEFWEEKTGDFQGEYRGIQITQQVEREGYRGQGELLQAVGENPQFRRTVTLTLDGSETQ